MITDAHGRPIATEGNDLRYIKIAETVKDGKRMWAIDYHPGIQHFEFEEVFQILGQAIMGIAQNARARKHEAMLQQKLREEIKGLDKE